MVPAGASELPDGSKVYIIPSTDIVVDITVKKERVRTGPYARFAQKYFGAIAPLADKDTFEITSAEISWSDNSAIAGTVHTPTQAYEPKSSSNIYFEGEFPRVMPDKTSSATRTAEDGARDAAKTIYDIRKRRMELISGEYAETVFGEGLRTAVERLDEIEKEYLELFYGKKSIAVEKVRYTVTPERGQTTYILCRWNENRGTIPATDLTGQPILLELRPLGLALRALSAEPADNKKARKNEPVPTLREYAVADNVVCRITDGKREFGQRTVPVFQFGVTVMMP